MCCNDFFFGPSLGTSLWDSNSEEEPDGTFKLTSVTNVRNKVIFMWYFNGMFYYMLKVEFVTLLS